MAHPHAELLNRFYTAFAALDAGTMSACYAPEARFEDEVFRLHGRDQIGAMWRMLCETTQDKGRDVWRLRFDGVCADEQRGWARWQAQYRFSATGRLVHNVIAAEFEFRDGLIVTHRDHFGFWRWSRQALGAPGWWLGWSPLLRKKVRVRAAANLQAFIARPR